MGKCHRSNHLREFFTDGGDQFPFPIPSLLPLLLMPWVYCCHEPVRFDGERVAIGSRVEAFSASDDIIATEPDRD